MTASIEVRTVSAFTDTARTLLAGSQAALAEAFPPEEIFTIDEEDYRAPNVQFLAAFVGGMPAGCVTLVDEGRYGEVKRFYVALQFRGQGVGTVLMDALEAAARDIGLRQVKLETGPALVAATALYHARGYHACAPFGGYPDLPSNAFLAKALD